MESMNIFRGRGLIFRLRSQPVRHGKAEERGQGSTVMSALARGGALLEEEEPVLGLNENL